MISFWMVNSNVWIGCDRVERIGDLLPHNIIGIYLYRVAEVSFEPLTPSITGAPHIRVAYVIFIVHWPFAFARSSRRCVL